MDNKNISKKIISGTILTTMLMYTTPIFAYTKDETVYSKLNNNGEQYKSIVSTHLNNSENEKMIKDLTNLINISNTNGSETFTKDGDNIIWEANNNDIYYQGETENKLPIKVQVKYMLNGEEIDAKDIVGKEGKVTVIIRYTNTDEHILEINGKNEKMYTPFVVIAGTIIDNEKNTNIEITNGKVIDDGSRTLVLGMAFPGLQESLCISSSKIEIPSEVKISMDAKDFEMNSIMSFVTPKVIEDDDIKLFDDIEKIYSQVNTLTSSSKELVAGANKLKDGTNEYNSKMQDFESAMKEISNGMTNANNSYNKINAGIKTLNSSSQELNSGAKEVADGINAVKVNLDIINEKLGELLAGGNKLKLGEDEILAGVNLIINKINGIPVTDNTEKINQLQTLVNTNTSTINTIKAQNQVLKTQYDTEIDEVKKAKIKAQMDNNKSLIILLQGNVKAEKETIAMLASLDATEITKLKLGLNQVKNGLVDLEKGTETLNGGIAKLKEGNTVLSTKTGELNKGAEALYKGTSKLLAGTKNLNLGSKQMKEGLNLLDKNGVKIYNANTQLTKGASSINEGATLLAEGMEKFDKEGISKISNMVNKDLKNFTEKTEKLIELSKQYNNFTMLEEGANGNVKFIMIQDALKKQNEEKDKKETAIIVDNKVEKKEEVKENK